MLCVWRVRKKGQEANHYEDYRDFPSVFCLKINQGGTFTTPPMIRYKGGKVNWVDDIDSDIFSIVEVTSMMMKELGYENPCMVYYYKKPNTALDNGLIELAVDKDVCEMLMYVDKVKVIELYNDHLVNKKHVFIQEPLTTTSEPNEPDIGSGSKAEVDVSKDGWLKDNLKKLPIKSKKDQQPIRKEVESHGPDVEWVGCKETLVEENEVFELEEVDHEDFDSGSESDEGVRRKALEKVGRMNKAKATIWKENFFVGEQFATSQLVKEKVTRVSVEQRRQLWLKNDKLRVRVVCRGQVPDFANNNMGSVLPVTSDPKGPTSIAMQVSKLPNEDTWEVKTLEDTHKCLQSRIVNKCTTTFLYRKVEESIKPNPKIPLNAIKDQLQKKFEVGVSKQKVFRAKKMAYERVVRNYTQQYAQLRDCCMELKERNLNTIVKIEVEPLEDPNSKERKFKRIYICLGPLKDGFRAGGRDFLGLDGYFLSGPYPGQILTAVEVDPNNGIYPLAYAVVESESKDSWKWFLDCLGRAKSNILLNNMCEVLNRQLVCGKDKHIITCLEYIREYLMKRIVIVQKLQDKCDGPLTPNTAKIFKLIERAAAKFKVDWNGSDLYQVTCPWGDQFVVNMSEREKSDVPTTIIPPKPHPQIGRPPKKRKKSAAELAYEIMKSKKLARTGKSVTCSLCKQVGHNQRGRKDKKSGDAGAGSQVGGDVGASSQGGGDAGAGSQHACVGGSQTI
nr:hypothetical protein [Tanacetum cinerariifolium]